MKLEFKHFRQRLLDDALFKHIEKNKKPILFLFLLSFFILALNEKNIFCPFSQSSLRIFELVLYLWFAVISVLLLHTKRGSKKTNILYMFSKFKLLFNLTKLEHLSKYIHLIILFLIVSMGFYLRIYNLDGPSFGDDELSIFYVSKNVLEGEGFTLPSDQPYKSTYTDISVRAISMKILGKNEFGARFPSVIFGTLTIILSYFLGEKVGGKEVGLLSAFFISFLPWEISWSREARMYASFQFFYLLLILAFYFLFKKHFLKRYKYTSQISNTKKDELIQIASFFLFLPILLIIGFYVHQLIALFIPSLILFLILYFASTPKRKFSVILVAIFSILLIVFLITWKMLPYRLKIAFDPFKDISFYFEFLLNFYSLFFISAVFSIIFLLLKYYTSREEDLDKHFPLLLTSCLLVPLTAISLLFGTTYRANRYIYNLFPLIVILGSYFFVVLLREILMMLCEEKSLARFTHAIFVIGIIFLLVPFSISFDYPGKDVLAAKDYSYEYSSMTHPPWKELKERFKEEIEEDAVIISTNQLQCLYYFGRCDYYLRRFYIDEGTILKIYYFYDESSVVREIYTGAIWLKDYDEFVKAISNTTGYFIADYRFTNRYMPDGVVDYINNNFTLLLSLDEFKIFKWNFTTSS